MAREKFSNKKDQAVYKFSNKKVQAVYDRLTGHDVQFVSYDGSYPNLCSGTLVLTVDGERWELGRHSLISGGSVSLPGGWNAQVETGCWGVEKWPDGFPDSAKGRALEVVNDNIPKGCCGGCI